MKGYFAICLMLIVALKVNAQTLIGSAGTTMETNGYEFTYSIGEVGTLTLNDNSYYVTQGFCQPEDIISGIILINQPNIRFVPNPLISGILDVQMEDSNNHSINVHDFLGRQVFSNQLNGQVIDLSRLVAGTYVASIFSENGQKIYSSIIVKL